MTDVSAGGYMTLFPSNVPRPGSSNLNFVAGQTVANRVSVRVDPATGRARIYNDNKMVNVIVDVNRWIDDGYGSSTSGGYVPVAPTRILDTRDGSGGSWIQQHP